MHSDVAEESQRPGLIAAFFVEAGELNARSAIVEAPRCVSAGGLLPLPAELGAYHVDRAPRGKRGHAPF